MKPINCDAQVRVFKNIELQNRRTRIGSWGDLNRKLGTKISVTGKIILRCELRIRRRRFLKDLKVANQSIWQIGVYFAGWWRRSFSSTTMSSFQSCVRLVVICTALSCCGAAPVDGSRESSRSPGKCLPFHRGTPPSVIYLNGFPREVNCM